MLYHTCHVADYYFQKGRLSSEHAGPNTYVLSLDLISIKMRRQFLRKSIENTPRRTWNMLSNLLAGLVFGVLSVRGAALSVAFVNPALGGGSMLDLGAIYHLFVRLAWL